MLLDGLFKANRTQPMHDTAAFLNNTIPIFGQFGRDIYTSDIVQTCVDCIASECSKLQPQHIRRDPRSKKLLPLPGGDALNRLFSSQPNPIMTTHDFIEKVVWTLYLNYNAFIYPAYNVVTDARGNTSRSYTGLWPLAPMQVEWMEDMSGALFVKMTFRNGKQFTLPYEDLIHLRKKFSINDIMGGGDSGQPNNAALIQTLQINDTILQGTAQSVKLSQGIRGVLKLNTTVDDGKKDAERKAFMNAITNGEGVPVMDFKGDFTPVTINPAVIDATTLSFIENKVLRWFGVSLPILNGDYTDDQYQAFYNKTLKPIIIAMNQAFSSILFSSTELAYGNRIEFYSNTLELMDVKNKLALVDALGNRGAITNNELRALFGMPPMENGDVRMASLNYVSMDIINQYQILKATRGFESVSDTNSGDKAGLLDLSGIMPSSLPTIDQVVEGKQLKVQGGNKSGSNSVSKAANRR